MNMTATGPRRAGALLLAFVLGLPAVAAELPQYDVTFLGPLVPGWSAEPGRGATTALNEDGDAVGWVTFASSGGKATPFLYTGGSLVVLPTPDWAVTAVPEALADRSADGGITVVGWAADSIYSGDLAVAWHYDPGAGTATVEDLGVLEGGNSFVQYSQSRAQAINNVGDIIGYSTSFMQFGGPVTHFTPDGPVQVPAASETVTATARSSDNTDVTDSRWALVYDGSVGGTVRTHLGTGEAVVLGKPEGRFVDARGNGINEALQVAATVRTGTTGQPNDQYTTQIWRYDPLAGWQYLYGGTSPLDQAKAINAAGDVLGGATPGYVGRSVLYLADQDAAYGLTSLLAPAFADAVIATVHDLNDARSIGASGDGPLLLTVSGDLQPPPTPTGLAAVPHPASPSNPGTWIDLSWTDNSDAAEHFIVQRADAGSAFADRTTTTATSYRDPDVTPGVVYDYRIVAVNAAGASPPSTTVTVVGPAGPDAVVPGVTVLEPADGAAVGARRVAIRAEVTDDQELAMATVSARSATGETLLICSQTVSGTVQTVECSWNLRKVAAGDWTITVSARDRYGNMAEAAVAVVVGSGGDDGGKGGGNGGGKGGGKGKPK